jgi:hypothetical protein
MESKSKFELEETLLRKKVDTKKIEVSIKSLDYYTQNYFSRDNVIPIMPLSESSRYRKNNDEKN